MYIYERNKMTQSNYKVPQILTTDINYEIWK